WLSEQSDDACTSVLPLLRRTFARFSAPERRTLGERAKSSQAARIATGATRPAEPVATPAADVAPPPEAAASSHPEAAAEPEAAAHPAERAVRAEPADAGGFDLLDDLLGL